MLETQRRQQELQEQSESPIVKNIVDMLENAVTISNRFLKKHAAKMAEKWAEELKKRYKNLGSLKKQLSDAVGKLSHLTLEQRENIWKLVEHCFNPKPIAEPVNNFWTLIERN